MVNITYINFISFQNLLSVLDILDGMIGNDFLRNFNANINYKSNILSINENTVPLQYKCKTWEREMIILEHTIHTLYEWMQSKNILVKSVDTDVLLLLIHYYNAISEVSKCHLFKQLGHSTNERYLSINDISRKLGKSVCTSLLTIHCLTGCDSSNSL